MQDTSQHCLLQTVQKQKTGVCIDFPGASAYVAAAFHAGSLLGRRTKRRVMKIRNSLKSAKIRDKDCRVVRRRGRVYVINKKNPRMKARQG
ncbi:hypothetical protein AOE01nite_03710 [Acetobacter oeni]|uniref:Large ribosomal subunit protein bL36 n=9 Tax=Acetobacteraceae TaxID=433 RepID=A0A511XGR6_9PROT|nr:50S ribosomal protein L36 [Acetobacter oeni LMG 21952]GEN62147.1 hypothetical protein AOE01nite_03710 [Acetobacter oeni]